MASITMVFLNLLYTRPQTNIQLDTIYMVEAVFIYLKLLCLRCDVDLNFWYHS